MPAFVRGNAGSGRALADTTKDFEYDYPDGLDLKPGSELHQRLVTEILSRALESRGALSRRFPAWREVDKTLVGYIKADDAEQEVQDSDERRPISIVFPYSFAMLETLLTYLVIAFFQDPIFKYEGVGPEDTVGATLLEMVVRLHTAKTKVPLALHTHFRDSLAYGIGAVLPSWEVRRGTRIVRGSAIDGGESKRELIDGAVLFEGNRLDPVDPYCLLPDPNVPLSDLQQGEFVGWIGDVSYVSLLSKELYDEDLFNVKYLALTTNKKSSLTAVEDEREKRYGSYNGNSLVTDRVDIIYMYVDIVPSEWGLSDRNYPEKWLFWLGADAVILKARPSRLAHGQHPICVAAPDFDGYSTSPISRLESMGGLQTAINFLWNSHVTNVRKAINDMLVVDPYLVNIKDLEDPQPGKLIRLRRPAWGRGVKDAVMQLGVTDITRTNIADIQFAMQMMNRMAGADDSMMGLVRMGGPERLTGGEFQGTRVGQMSRLERVARVIGMQSMQDIAYMFASHTQQFMENEVFVQATGQWMERLVQELGVQPGAKVPVTPMDLLVEYDVLARDGSIPGGNFSQAEIQLFQIIASNELLMPQFDMFRLFSHIARNLGMKNVEDFKVKVQPNDVVANEAQKGNLVPMPMPGGMPGGMMPS